jgi:hypothetical protein
MLIRSLIRVHRDGTSVGMRNLMIRLSRIPWRWIIKLLVRSMSWIVRWRVALAWIIVYDLYRLLLILNLAFVSTRPFAMS